MANRIILNTVSFHGKGAIGEIPGIAMTKGFQHVFVCSDPDLVKFGVTAKVTDLLDEAGIPYTVYSGIKPNPTVENVKDGVKAFRDCGADSIITIGGGSSMDTSKANYVITDTEKERKFVCVDEHDIPEYAVVDPDMMSSMPKGLTAATGMDALTHAIEGYTTKAAWEMTDMFHLEAIRLIAKHLRGAVQNIPEDREGMALAQYVAGMGFSNVGLGIAHSIAHTLGAHYDTPHGVACAMMLPIVMEYNQECTGEKYREIARAMGVKGVDEMTVEEYRRAAVDAVRQLSADVGIPEKNEKVREEDLDCLAQDAYDDACRPGNPRDTSVEELKELYRRIMVG